MSSDTEDDFQLSASDNHDSGSDYDEFAFEDKPVAKVIPSPPFFLTSKASF